MGFSIVVTSEVGSQVVVHRLLIAVASLVVEPVLSGFSSCGTWTQ